MTVPFTIERWPEWPRCSVIKIMFDDGEHQFGDRADGSKRCFWCKLEFTPWRYRP